MRTATLHYTVSRNMTVTVTVTRILQCCDSTLTNRPALLPSSLSSLQVFKDYFGELEEESIRDNFVVVYELLDETMDFGYPQTCESKILREYVTQCTLRAVTMCAAYCAVLLCIALRGIRRDRIVTLRVLRDATQQFDFI